MKKKEILISSVLLCFSVLGLALFIDHIVRFVPADYFYKDGVPLDPYTNVNVVSRWANFSYFTYLSLIMFCLFGIAKFFSTIFGHKIDRLKRITDSPYVIIFVCVNQFFVLIVYTASEIAFGGKFGWYGNNFGSIYSLVTNLIIHYLITSVAIIYFFTVKAKVTPKYCLWYAAFFVVYGIAVKITGMYCYRFEWYPYPFFSAEGLWHKIFVGKEYNEVAAVILDIAVIAIIAAIYAVTVFAACKIISKNARPDVPSEKKN